MLKAPAYVLGRVLTPGAVGPEAALSSEASGGDEVLVAVGETPGIIEHRAEARAAADVPVERLVEGVRFLPRQAGGASVHAEASRGLRVPLT